MIMYSRKLYLVFLFTAFTVLFSNELRAENPFLGSSQNVALQVPGSFRGPSPNVKLIPSVYWNTYGLEFEYPAGLVSFGVVGMYKFNERFGNDKNFRVRPEDYQKDGFRAELFGRYYYRGEAPVGLYAEGKVFYNNIVYFDGNTMPYTLYNRWKDIENLRDPVEIKKPSPLGVGLATGIQIMVVQNVIIANLKAGMDLNQDSADNGKKLFITIYLQPSIGISF